MVRGGSGAIIKKQIFQWHLISIMYKSLSDASPGSVPAVNGVVAERMVDRSPVRQRAAI